MVWELGLDPENPDEAIEQTRAIQETRRELSRAQLLNVRARVLQLQCHPDTNDPTILHLKNNAKVRVAITVGSIDGHL